MALASYSIVQAKLFTRLFARQDRPALFKPHDGHLLSSLCISCRARDGSFLHGERKGGWWRFQGSRHRRAWLLFR